MAVIGKQKRNTTATAEFLEKTETPFNSELHGRAHWDYVSPASNLVFARWRVFATARKIHTWHKNLHLYPKRVSGLFLNMFNTALCYTPPQ